MKCNSRSLQWRIKRAIDLAVAVAILLGASPVLAGAALLIWWKMGQPIFFRQVRPGRFGRPFRLYKFRTMNDARGPDGHLLPDAQRLTGVGRFLRRSSLDELPQLWNVLRGEMSLVGPRPLLMEYLQHYTPRQARRHDVRPGITGWAQVNGRQGIPFSQRFELDVWYVDHWTLRLDLEILAKTFVRVFKAAGVKLEQELAEVDDLGLSASIRCTSVGKRSDLLNTLSPSWEGNRSLEVRRASEECAHLPAEATFLASASGLKFSVIAKGYFGSDRTCPAIFESSAEKRHDP